MTGNDQIEYASATNVGMRRQQNQDSHAVLLAGDEPHWRKQGHVFLVADGMGAHAVGELASEMAANTLVLTYHKYANEGPVAALERAVREANAVIHSRGQQNPDFHGMGTTSTVLVLRPEGAWIAHVGDSRAYRIRSEQIEQLTFDHSLLWEMARRKKVRPERLQGVPSNRILRSLGPQKEVQADIEGPHPLREGDTFLLCSDGLSGQVTDQEIGIVAGHLPPAEACTFLVDLANFRGGPDNVTVVIARVRSTAGCVSSADAGTPQRWYRRMLRPLGSLVNRGAERPETRSRPKIYQRVSCEFNSAFLEKLTQADATLERMMREKRWETDWETRAQHRQEAAKLWTRNDWIGALRAYAQAIHPLAEVLQKHRHELEEDLKII